MVPSHELSSSDLLDLLDPSNKYGVYGINAGFEEDDYDIDDDGKIIENE